MLYFNGLALLLVFILYMISYEVSFNKSAIVLTFGRASEKDVITSTGLRPDCTSNGRGQFKKSCCSTEGL